ncbi:amino acid/amide ABC transporter substrate-binding protein (HAAT family) [Sphaerotilus hippei]|uniref:Amino acid/amide ABC transporter substrate-binding protein (HAAT family) n=1 Tax=Sphaerotilus hippei TaxID=744406 RepID=A0A318H4Y8_9BURK|nr:branched-chain amino acid ABC transporter substrate-binding protein [Sphaerotilus hippei]PXW98801.1 amino acid/amide ABC transporter substrate-binding protein (HAAT family) [Sphaerotilus hippei]
MDRGEVRRSASLLVLGLGLAAGAHAVSFKAVLLVPADDTRLERSRVERAYLGHPTGAAIDGIQSALKEARLEMESAGASLSVEAVEVATLEAVRAAAQKAEKAGAVALLTDLPAAWTVAAADAARLPVLNLGEASDSLRQQDCRARLLHLAPSERMRADALAQTLISRRWQQVLLLTGPSPADALRSATAQAAIKRYGLKLVGSKPFKLSGDPRERDLANPLLLTQGGHDVVWVVDSDGEFARSLPYRTATPRPVVGDAGLVALAWHAQYDRFGAPQVSRRFTKSAGRPMSAHDWSAWLGGKALAAAAVAAPRGPAAAFQKALVEAELDGSKGVSMTFRPWDGQLRQPLLLSDGQGVIGTAPVDGVQHPKNSLDTLGADAPEKLCKVARP